jgi:Tfp pilus assembly protein PilN
VSFQTLEALTTRSRVVRVNLLPGEFAEARRTRTVRLCLGAGVLVVAGACAAAGVLSAQQVSQAQTGVDAAQTQTRQLQAEQSKYAEVPAVQKELAAAQEVEKTVNSQDVAWYGLLDQVAVSSPADLSLTNLAFSLSSASTTASTSTDVLAVPGVGSVTATGQTRSQEKVAAWLESMAGVPGVGTPTLSDSSLDATTGVVTFTATAPLTADVLLDEQ